MRKMAYKYKLDLKKSEKELFQSWSGACRFVFNACLEQRKIYHTQFKKSLSKYDQIKVLPEAKKTPGLEWLKLIPSQLLQQCIIDLDRAFQNFFKTDSCFPKFKNKKSKNSFRFPSGQNIKIEKVSRKRARVNLPKVGKVFFRYSRKLEGKIKNVTISKDRDDWYISFCCEVEDLEKLNNQSSVGIDRGVKHTLYLSDGSYFDLPSEKIKKIEKRIAKKQIEIKHKKKFSNNWKKERNVIGNLHRKITRIRHNFLHQTSSKLSKKHGYVVLEDLKIKNMSKSSKGSLESPGKNVKAKSGLNRSILRQGWFEFERQLAYKLDWRGGYLTFVSPKFTSQICSQCGNKDKESRLNQETFVCTNCNFKENADLNAAINILALGHRATACQVDHISDLATRTSKEQMPLAFAN